MATPSVVGLATAPPRPVSDLIGGHALAPVKVPNPTYYLP